MSPPSALTSTSEFIALALKLQLLTAPQATALTLEAEQNAGTPGQIASQLGLLTLSQVDIVETLLRPDDSIPGYEVLALLGRGGMGVVYRARQKSLNRIVALKTVLVSQLQDHAALQRFEQEAQAVGKLAHPHIIAAYDFGKHAARLYFAMELVEGEDLDQLLVRRGCLDELTTWGLIRQAATALAHAAQMGIVHRDVKPANLLLVEPPAGYPLPEGMPLVKVADFGLALLVKDNPAEPATRLTTANTTLGSPHYMAPEQLEGGQVDQRADIYALGATAYHMLGGKPPFAALSVSALIAQKLTSQPRPLRELNASLSPESEALVALMMQRESQTRIASYPQLLAQIDHFSAGLTSAGDVSKLYVAATAQTQVISLSQVKLPAELQVKASPPTTSLLRRWLGIGGALSLATLMASSFAFPWAWEARNPPRPRTPELTLAGTRLDLFNGKSLAGWKNRSGFWQPGKNSEAAEVLSGGQAVVRTSVISRSLQLAKATGPAAPQVYYRLTLIADLQSAAGTELHFNFADKSDNPARSVLRLTAEGICRGQRAQDLASFQPIGTLLPYSVDPSLPHTVQLELQPSGYWLFVDEVLVGVIPRRTGDPAAEFRLLVERGPAWFSDFILEPLLSP